MFPSSLSTFSLDTNTTAISFKWFPVFGNFWFKKWTATCTLDLSIFKYSNLHTVWSQNNRSSHIPANNNTKSRSEWTKIQQMCENVHPNIALVLLFVRTEVECWKGLSTCFCCLFDLQLSSCFCSAAILHYATKKLFDFLFSDWFLHASFTFIFPL